MTFCSMVVFELTVWRRRATSDQKLASSTPAGLCNDPRKVVQPHVPLSPKHYNLVMTKG